MLTSIALHCSLEAFGGLSMRCVVGVCKHRRHQTAAWIFLALCSSMLLVAIDFGTLPGLALFIPAVSGHFLQMMVWILFVLLTSVLTVFLVG
jgi:hypothetical protein